MRFDFKQTIKYFLVVFLYGAGLIISYAQNISTDMNCAFDAIHKQQLDQDAQYEKAVKLYEQELLNLSTTRTPNLYELPVVVHIVHGGGGENLSDLDVAQGMSYLNQAFANSGYYDQNIGVDTRIQFCLAKQDESGNATSGITRTLSSLTDLAYETQDGELKDLSRWNPTEYINIWLVKEICSVVRGCGVAGYAYLPAVHGGPQDGIVMEARYFNRSEGTAGVTIHEMGHYLGLYHTFQNGCKNDDCLVDGDRVCDTPPDQSTARVPCGGMSNSCSTDANSGLPVDEDDHFWNYMDYGDFNCYAEFTAGQRTRMHLSVEGIRSSLLNSTACNDPCPISIQADFNASSIIVNIGGQVNFTDASTNATELEWLIDDVVFANNVSTTSYTFNQVGLFEITLKAGNGDPNCETSKSIVIEIVCGIDADFSSSSLSIAPGEQVLFTNTSSGATSYVWTVNNVQEGVGNNLNYFFNSEGAYTVCLTAGNGLCDDRTCATIYVEMPGDSCNSKTFIKVIGDAGSVDEGYSIIPSGDGHLFLGASEGNSTVIIKMTINGDILYQRKFDFTGLEELIADLIIDSDGYLVGCGLSRQNLPQRMGFVFKYDHINDNMIWTHQLSSGTRTSNIMEISASGNYILTAQQYPIEDGLMFELDRATGAPTGTISKSYDLAASETFLSAQIHNNQIYTSGRFNANGGTRYMRSSFSKFDLDGNEIFSYLSHVSASGTARLYATDFVEDQGRFYVNSTGDDDGTSVTNINFYLSFYEDDGTLNWVRKYDIQGMDGEWSDEITKTSDGLLIFGRNRNPNSNLDLFLIKVDFQGDVIWSKSYGGINEEIIYGGSDNQLLVAGDYIFFLGRSSSFGSDENIILIKTDREGNVNNDCAEVKELNTLVSTISNISNELVVLTESPAAATLNSVVQVGTNTDMAVEDFCDPDCIEICDNAIDDDGDGLVDCEDEVNCPTPDLDIEVNDIVCINGRPVASIRICNLGAKSIGPNIPVGIYNENPEVNASATLLDISTTNFILFPEECTTISIELSSGVDNYYFIVNDNGSILPAFILLTDFPSTDTLECSYQNNIANMSFSFQSPSLDLGPDVEVCDNGVITFDAGMGWLSTRWFDGSEERTITVWEPGVVSVVVTDSCGNEFYDSVRVTINPTTVLNLGDDITICQGDTAEIGVSGFTTYQWFPQNQVPCVDCPEIEVVPDTATCYILVAGNAAGCYSVDTIKVEIGGDTIYVSDTITICFGDSALIFGSMETIAGKYNMILTSPGGCIIDSTITLDYYGPMALQSTTRPTCGGLSTGSANVLVSGGQPPYQYEWSATNSDSNKVENLPAGIYDVTVSDENNCFLFYRLFIDSMSAPEVDLQVIDVSCFGDDDGELTIVSTNSDLSFSILGDSSFQSENIFNQLPAGSYTLSVMGVLNCIYYFDFNITEPDEISLQLPPDEIIQLGDSVEIIAVTNRVNLIYQWSEEPGLSCRDCPTTIAGPATTTTYQLVVQDSSGCMSSDSITIIVEFNKRVFVPNAFSPNNDGVNDKLLVFAGKELNRVLELNIYNRWGGKVFERVNFPANDQNYGWDGTVEGEVMNPGVFTWWAKVEFLNGDVDVLKGNVTLVK